TIAGLEVGEIISSVGDWEGIIVAQVVEVARHPNADRLVLATVELSPGERQTVVCGAPNVAVGQKIAFASAGTRLLDGHTGKPVVLKSAVIRGVESAGMICSERELGISDESEGILVLADDAVVGRPLESQLGEVVFDLDLTPNRPDLFSIVGVAREVAALTGQPLREPSIERKEAGPQIAGRLKIEISDRDLCPRYCAALIEGVKVAESPAWLQERLISAGLRPVNNIVDITNYVMLELGQPLHAFDLAKIRGKKIIVRRARPGEKMLLLDGTERELSPEMLVIADAELPLALAGVMGGLSSEVDQGTTAILLESANFQAASIRRTSKALKVRTDASTRFEKGLSRQLPSIAAERAVKLIVELCGGRAAKGLVDVFPGKQADLRVTLTQERLHRILGIEVPRAQVRQILTSLGFGCRWVPPDRFVVRVPYWRTDVAIADDVVEEIARIIGYDALPTSLLRGEIPPAWPQPRYRLRERVRDAIAAAGFQEIITYSLTSMETLARVLAPEELAVNRPLRIANPMSREAEYGRTTLRASLLSTLAANAKAGVDLLSLFEAGRVYLPQVDDLPQEVESVCAVLSGRRPDRWGQPVGEPVGFYDAKAYLEQLLDVLRVPVTVQEVVDFAYLPGRTAAVLVDGRQVGLVGQVHPRVAASFGIEAEVAMFELNLDALQPHVPDTVHFRPVPQYPPVAEDLAIIVPEAVAAGQAIGIIKSFPLVRAASVFDVYTGPPVPAGKKSLAFALTFQAADHTLTDAEVSHQRQRIVERLRRELGAELRA
ncbi:MAG: phenylalanine--tRNA ligase subunit beta, partial [Dehalococcoidia bacterium]